MPIHRPEERLVQARFLIEFVQLLDPLPGVRGGRFEQTTIIAAVALGELEGRPFGASKLAEFLRLPRPTLMRRLNGLEKDGHVERRDGRYFLSDRINAPDVTERTAQVTDLILAAAAELGRLRGK